MTETILVTGGAGFIGSNFVIDWLANENSSVLNLDKLTYAGNMANLQAVAHHPKHIFVQGDIGDRTLVKRLLATYRPSAIVNFAAESHVDRSISGPGEFIQTNVIGTFSLLEEVKAYWLSLEEAKRSAFRFLHISTDEVFGSLDPEGAPFSETTAYAPNSPYSASKAASDHFMRAYFHTYGFPTMVSHCSNNYGPHQFPEKLIPLAILNSLQNKPLPIYGDGLNIRDWLYVTDHCEALKLILKHGRPGETYNIGGNNEKTNLEVIYTVCGVLDECLPRKDRASYQSLITFVKDRPGHDRRYAINAQKIQRELDWRPAETFETGIHKTIAWYLAHPEWVEKGLTTAYYQWVDTHYHSVGLPV